ncbi:tetratricopeptide repeat protein [Beggiatoa leptomitoformis]|uniref:Tetratricopeptide repeat protein n=1 Tax=Beggiatoa leptomitoformis TaxID=288004 RepID=A0A2N9YHQ6_9GAMM|nr:tetratricopeptide repeat protein [Beggiatoa leptomitoformis]AUI70040.1 tetratricopeptide repeat protein [Beggiatoa leptomitoformis]QGX03644.1 tetratricopeptide repeat protein [Beggiatoa leptomitoformis]
MNDKTVGNIHIEGVSDSNITIQQAGRNIIINGVAVDTHNALLENFIIADQVLQRIARDCATQKLNETQRLLLVQREVEAYLTHTQQIEELFANLPESIKAQPIIQQLHTALTQAANDGNYQQFPDIMERAIELLTSSSLRELHPDFWYILYRLHAARAELFDYQGYYEKSAWEWHKASEVLPVPPYKNDLTRSETRLFRALYSTCLYGAGEALRQAGHYSQAQEYLAPALQWREKLYADNPNHLEIAQSLNGLALLYQDQGDYAQALPLSQRTLAIDEKVLGTEHPHTAQSLNNLAGLYQAQGDYAQALPLLQRALAIDEKVLGTEHPHTAQSLNNLAGLYQAQGDYAQALPLLQRALAIREKVLGTEHPHTASSLNNLAMLYQDQGDYAQALPLLQQALAIDEKVLGAEHPHTAHSLNNLATLYEAQGDYAQALPLLQQAIEIIKKKLGEEHPDYKTAYHNYQIILNKMQQPKAEPITGAEHSDYEIGYQNYQKLLNEMQQPKTAPKPKAEPIIEEPEKPQTIIDKLKKWWK